MRVVLLACALLLAACGTNSTEGDDIDRRYRECIEAGGDFDKDRNDWSCKNIPKEEEIVE